MSNISIVCPKCGGKKFKVAVAEVKTYEDFFGSVCVDCGATMTEDDIRKQAAEIAEKIARDIFKKK